MVQALESDSHLPHLVWLNKSLDVPLIPNLPDDAPIVCHGQGFVTRAAHHPRPKAGLFLIPRRSAGKPSVQAGAKQFSPPLAASWHSRMRGTFSKTGDGICSL